MAFDSTFLHDALPQQSPDSFRLVPLSVEHLCAGFPELLAQLTTIGMFEEKKWARRLKSIHTLNAEAQSLWGHPIYCPIVAVAQDMESDWVIGTATLLIEKKFIHSTGQTGHIEDVVVDDKHRALGVGSALLTTLVAMAEAAKCYKVLLDCSEKTVPFYERNGFSRKETQMVRYTGRSSSRELQLKSPHDSGRPGGYPSE